MDRWMYKWQVHVHVVFSGLTTKCVYIYIIIVQYISNIVLTL